MPLDMDPDIQRECHVARGLSDNLDFEVALPMGWQAETAPGRLGPQGTMNLLWQACSMDTVAHQQLKLQVSASRLPDGAEPPPDAPTNALPDAAPWCASKGLQVVEAPLQDGGRRLQRLQAGRSAVGTARVGPGDAAPIVHFAYTRHGPYVMELLLRSPASRAELSLKTWRHIAASWRMRTPWPKPGKASRRAQQPQPTVAVWWIVAQALHAQGRLEEALLFIERECPQAGRYLAQADLLARQMRLERAAGRTDLALQLQERAVDCGESYVGCATSGGEAKARMWELKNFLAAEGLEG